MATNYRSGFFVSKSRDPLVNYVTSPTSKQYTCATGVLNGTTYGGGDVLTRRIDEVISYTQGPKRFNKCEHLRTRFEYSGNPASFDDITAVGTGICTHYSGHHAHAITAHETVMAISDVANARKYEPLGALKSPLEYANLAMDRLKPDLTQLSLPNFLLDAGQIKDLFVVWKQNVGLLKNIAGGYLNYKFGWRPTVSDIDGMIRAVVSMDHKLRDWEKSLNFVTLDRCTLASAGYSASGTINYTGNPLYPCRWNVATTGKIQAFIKYRVAPLPAMSQLERGIRGYLDAFGVELNPQIIWDKIPFSFVIDWFFGVGQWLSRFKLDTLELPIFLEDFCLQYKEEMTVTSALEFNDPSFIPFQKVPHCSTKVINFSRYPIVPDPATLVGLGWKLPSINQWKLSGALAVVLAPSKRKKTSKAGKFIGFAF